MANVLFIDCAGSPLYKPEDHIRPFLPVNVDYVHMEFGEHPQSLERYTHVIISGSMAPSYESRWQSECYRFVRNVIGYGIPTLGICYGHQIIIREIFGKDAIRPKASEDIGWEEVTVCVDDILLGKERTKWFPFAYHGYEVSNVPSDEVTVIASSARCKIMAYKFKNKPIWGFQPHFEISKQQAVSLMENYGVKETAGMLTSSDERITFAQHTQIFNSFLSQ